MTANSKRLPPGSAPCAACGRSVSQRDKTGEVRIFVTVKPGTSTTLTEPICPCCALKANSSTEELNAVLRAARFRVWEEMALPDDERGDHDKLF